MNDDITTQAILTLLGGIVLGPLIGGLVGWWRGFAWGIGTGCLIIGIAGIVGASSLGWHRHESLAGTEKVEGVLIDWLSERHRDSDGNVTTLHAPLVRFKARDGRTHEVKGLGRSDRGIEPGSAVPVRYRPEDPSQALVDDFQNLWGGVWGLGLFGVIPMLMGLFFVGTAISDARAPHRPAPREEQPLPRWRQRLTGLLTKAAAVVLVGAFVAIFVGVVFADAAFVTLLGSGFVAISAACALWIASGVIGREYGWETVMILVIIATGFAAFGIGTVLLES